MSVLLAVGNEEYAKIMRQLLSNYYQVINDDVASRKFLNEKVEIYNPSMVIIQENYLPSDFTTNEEREKEMLNIIENWRIMYNDSIRVVYFCVRDKKDPFIRQLIARNVLDIFNERSVSGTAIVEQLSKPAKYSNISKFTSIGAVQYESFSEAVDSTVEERSEINELANNPTNEPTNEVLPESSNANNIFDDLDELDALDDIEGIKESNKKVTKPNGEPTPKKERKSTLQENLKDAASKVGTSLKGVTEKFPKTTSKEQDVDMIQEIFIEDFIDLNADMFNQNIIKNTVIGTVLISVASVKSHLGSTHTALALGSYLANKGHSVAVVECTESQDFDRIHALYVGEKQLIKNESEFEINKVHHIKYRKNTPLNELYASFEYVIMDFSELQYAAAYIDEFYRSHIRIVVCSANEWHSQWIEQFLSANRLKKEDCIFVAPATSEQKAIEFAELIKYNDVYALPQQDSPYELQNQTEKVFSTILGPFIKTPSKMGSNKTVIVAVVLSVIVTAALVMIFTTL